MKTLSLNPIFVVRVSEIFFTTLHLKSFQKKHLFSQKFLNMTKKICILIAAVFFSVQMNAQDTTYSAPKKNNMHLESVTELILSWGDVKAAPYDVSNIVRFSAFLHLGGQLHIDFNPHLGFYTGLSLRNIGIITRLNDSVKIKQRVYTVGIPLALKFGNMAGTYFAVGVEGELAIAYKQKVFENNEKSKTNIWFSDRTNTFLPSAFAELRTKRGGYLKFGYYLSDFLRSGNQHINVPGIVYIPTQSQLAYVSFGFAIDKSTVKYAKSKTGHGNYSASR